MRRLIRRLRYAIRHRWLEADLAEELDFHREMKQRELEAGGLRPPEALSAARRALGNVQLVRDDVRDVWIWPWLQDVWQDFRFAARFFAKERGLAFVAMLTLAIGIGTNTMMFTFINAMVLRGLPIERPDRVVYISTRDSRDRERGMSYLDFQDATAWTGSFARLAAFATAPAALGGDDRAAERVLNAYVSHNLFGLLGEAPVLGRDFRADDDRPGAPAVVIVRNGLWQSRYAGDRTVLGRTITVNGVPSVIIGVVRSPFRFPGVADVWQPLSAMPGLASQTRNIRGLSVIGRLSDGVTLAQARSELDLVAMRLARDHPETNDGIQPKVVPINEHYNNGGITNPAWLAFTTVSALIVLVACANVANLLLMQSASRSLEIGIRASLGATRARVIRQLLVESALLAILGGLAGIGVAKSGISLFSKAIPENMLPYWMEYTMDARVFTVLAVVCLGTVFVVGLVPALHISRIEPHEVVKEGSRSSSGGVRARRWSVIFLTAEIAITLFMITGVVVGLGQFRAAQAGEVAIDTSRLLTAWVSLPPQKYRTSEERMAFVDAVHARLRAHGSIAGTAVASALPIGGGVARQLSIAGHEPAGREGLPTVWSLAVGASYFATTGVRLLKGRPFTETDGMPGHESAIVNQRLADMYFPNEDPIGRRIQLRADDAAGTAPWTTIVGVSPTVRQRTTPQPDPVVYLPLRAGAPPTVAFIVRTVDDPSAAAPVLHEEVRSLDPDLPLYRVLTMDDALSLARWNPRVSAMLFNTLASIAFVMAMVGLYTVTAHAIALRRREIGVRIAVGARSRQILWLVIRRAMVQLAIGLVAGVGLTFMLAALFGDPQASIRQTDASVLGAASFLIAFVALAACVIPAHRAARLDPVVALRHE
jgi:putative ABC transport system permease protein